MRRRRICGHDYRRARRVDNLWSIRGCSSVLSVSFFFAVFWAEMVWGYVFEGADFEKSGPESIRKLLDPESGS